LAWLGKANKTKEVIDGHGGAASAIDLPMITPAVLAPTLTEVSHTLRVCSERSPLRIRPKPDEIRKFELNGYMKAIFHVGFRRPHERRETKYCLLSPWRVLVSLPETWTNIILAVRSSMGQPPTSCYGASFLSYRELRTPLATHTPQPPAIRRVVYVKHRPC
jgi:hypothetical protein